jgi:hypothetical protein
MCFRSEIRDELEGVFKRVFDEILKLIRGQLGGVRASAGTIKVACLYTGLT